MKIRYFGDNGKYFAFLKKNKEKINVKRVKILNKKIYVKYELLEGANI